MTILDQLRAGVTTSSAMETRRIAEKFATALPIDATVALHGNLGVGKTTFVQGLARGFGIAEAVTSPTFNIYTIHRSPTRTLVHLDAYRLDDARQLENLLLEDFLVSPWCLAVEWPEKIPGFLPPRSFELDLGIVADEQHTLRLR